MKKSVLILIVIASFPFGVFAQTTYRGEASLETRAFTTDDIDETEEFNTSLFLRGSIDHEMENSKLRLRAFLRSVVEDDSRNLIVLEEAFYAKYFEKWELRVGPQILSWTATEAFHPADVLNSRNLDGNFEGAEKMGEPMIQAIRLTETGKLSFYYLPVFTQPKLAESSNRFSFVPQGFDLNKAKYINSEDELSDDHFQSQWAIRWDNSFESFDLGLHFIDHIDRSQPLIGISAGEVQPIYLPVRQTGLTLQAPINSWVFKVEAAYRDFENDILTSEYGLINQADHGQLALGLDYGFAHERGSESTFIMEWQRYLGVNKEERAALGIFQNDLLLGYRYAFNDAFSKELFFFLIHDLERENETMLNIKYSQRLSDTWSFETGLLLVDAPTKELQPQGLESLNQDNQLFFNLSRFF